MFGLREGERPQARLQRVPRERNSDADAGVRPSTPYLDGFAAPAGDRAMADIVLINPQFQLSYWGLEHALPFLGKARQLPAGLPAAARGADPGRSHHHPHR